MKRPFLWLVCVIVWAGCASKHFGPTHIVDPAAFEKGRIQHMALIGGDTLYPDVENEIVDTLSGKFANVAKLGAVYRRQAVLVQLGSVHLPPPDARRVRAQAQTFGDADPALAREMREKVGADAFFVVWVTDWSGSPVKSWGLSPASASEKEYSEVHRQVVVEVFEAGTGRELWHTLWESSRYRVEVKLVAEDAYREVREKEIQQAIEDIWVRFWIG
jgi:hypothetical protein